MLTCLNIWALLGSLFFILTLPSLAHAEYLKTSGRWPHAVWIWRLFLLATEGLLAGCVLVALMLVLGSIWGDQPLAQDHSQLFPGGSLGLLLGALGIGLAAAATLILFAFVVLYRRECRRWGRP
jgi:hypothetical protein